MAASKVEVKLARLTKVVCARDSCSKKCSVAAVAGETPAYCSRRCFGGPAHVACKGCGEPVSEARLRSGARFCQVACQARAAKVKAKLRDVDEFADADEPTDAQLLEEVPA